MRSELAQQIAGEYHAERESCLSGDLTTVVVRWIPSVFRDGSSREWACGTRNTKSSMAVLAFSDSECISECEPELGGETTSLLPLGNSPKTNTHNADQDPSAAVLAVLTSRTASNFRQDGSLMPNLPPEAPSYDRLTGNQSVSRLNFRES